MNYSNWYCVQVASGCENKAKADLLARKAVLNDSFIKGVEVPETTSLVFDKSGKKKAVKSKVLPGYILVQVSKQTVELEDGEVIREFPRDTQQTIRSTFNVLGFAGLDKNKPTPMRASEAKTLFDRVDETHLEVKTNVRCDYQIGDILEVIGGPFVGSNTEVVGIQGDKILGQLDMFGRSIPAEFTLQQVRKL